jgi:DNA-directed RNA polymerase specialized sigma24 family protein
MSDPPPIRNCDQAGGGAVDAHEVLDVCRRRIAFFRSLSPSDREDAAQQAATRVLEAIATGAVTNAAAYARRVSYHCGVDAWRRARAETSTQPDGSDPAADVDATAGPVSRSAPNPEQLADEKRRAEVLARIGAELRTLLETAPDNYRQVLVRRYLEDRSLEDIVLEEIERRVARGLLTHEQALDAEERKRIQNAVHAWHSRAIRWLQQRACPSWREVLR